MQKQTKNIITRDYVKNELLFRNKATLRSALLVSIVTSLVFIPLAWITVPGALSVLRDGIFKFVFGFLYCVVLGTPVWILICGVCRYLFEIRAIKTGCFEITVRRLTLKEEKLVNYGRNSRLEEHLHFNGFHSVEVGHTAFQLATEGDDYYIIHYSKKKQIELVYSTKTYEYK